MKKFSPLVVFLLAFIIIVVALQFLFQKIALGADFYIYYTAGKNFLMQGKSPYSPEQALQAQMGIYQHPASPQQDQVKFAYPPYSLFAIMPTFFMSYSWAEAFWLGLNLLLLVTAIYLGFPGAPRWLGVSFLFFYPVFVSLIVGNFNALIASILILIYAFVIQKIDRPIPRWQQIVLGVLLAWCTTKPQFIYLFVIFILFFTFKNRLWVFLISFFAGFVSLLLLSWLVVPKWLPEWLSRLSEYTVYNRNQITLTSYLSAFLPVELSNWITIFFALVCLAVSIKLIHEWWKDKQSSLNLFIWVGFLTYLFHPNGTPYEQLTFLVPLVCWAGVKPNHHKPWWQWLIFWFLFIPLTWGTFILHESASVPSEKWPLILFALFGLWYLRPHPLQKIRKSLST